MKTITLRDPDFAGTYTVERRSDGGLVLEPIGDAGPSEATLIERAGGRRLTPEEFADHFGDLPTDREG